MPAGHRLKRFQETIAENSLDAAIIEDPTNLYYLLGTKVSKGSLLCTPSEAKFFVDARYYEKCRKESSAPVVLAQKGVLEQLLEDNAFDEIHTLGFDSEKTTVATLERWQEVIKKNERGNFTFKRMKSPLKPLRAIKDEKEIHSLTTAAQLGSKGYDFVQTLLRTGITEIEVAKELEIFWLQQGGNALAFDPIIAFGPNSSIPHYMPAHYPLKEGEPILLDIGVTLNEYHSDMTRVLFFGEPAPEIKKVYELVREAQQMALNLCKPGITTGELDQTVRDFFENQGYGDKFTHSLGHGIGLEVHEFPVLSSKGDHGQTVLKPGMAVTVEPGLYLEGLGGVRIEDTIVITEEGHLNLTSRSKELKILSTSP